MSWITFKYNMYNKIKQKDKKRKEKKSSTKERWCCWRWQRWRQQWKEDRPSDPRAPVPCIPSVQPCFVMSVTHLYPSLFPSPFSSFHTFCWFGWPTVGRKWGSRLGQYHRHRHWRGWASWSPWCHCTPLPSLSRCCILHGEGRGRGRGREVRRCGEEGERGGEGTGGERERYHRDNTRPHQEAGRDWPNRETSSTLRSIPF